MAISSDRYVCLLSGLAVPVEPVLLLLDLEARGFTFTLSENDRLTVHPGSALTPIDKAALARWKPHVLALIDHAERVQ